MCHCSMPSSFLSNQHQDTCPAQPTPGEQAEPSWTSLAGTKHQPPPHKSRGTLLGWRPTPSLPKSNQKPAISCWEGGLPAPRPPPGEQGPPSPSTGSSLPQYAEPEVAPRTYPGRQPGTAAPPALCPRTAIPPGAHPAKLPHTPLSPSQTPHLQPALAEPVPSRFQQLLQTILPWQSLSREAESSHLPAVCSSR